MIQRRKGSSNSHCGVSSKMWSLKGIGEANGEKREGERRTERDLGLGDLGNVM